MIKVIKVLAIILAILIIVSVFTAIAFTVAGIGGAIFGSKEYEKISLDEKVVEEITNLDLNVSASRLTLKESSDDTFRVVFENVPEFISYKIQDDTFRIISSENNINFNSFRNSKIYIYLPKGKTFDDVRIEVGAGNIESDAINCVSFDLSVGAGNAEFDNLNSETFKLSVGAGRCNLSNAVVTKKAYINSGAGAVRVSKSEMTRLTLEAGVGKVEIEAKLLGENSVDSGVGSISLDLLNQTDEQFRRISITKGVGSLHVNGKSYSDDFDKNNVVGENTLSISGGVGSIDLNYEE